MMNYYGMILLRIFRRGEARHAQPDGGEACQVIISKNAYPRCHCPILYYPYFCRCLCWSRQMNLRLRHETLGVKAAESVSTSSRGSLGSLCNPTFNFVSKKRP